MVTDMRKWAVGVMALATCGAAALAADEAAPVKLPFILSAETTAIVSPLKADGTPDYLKAMNEKYGKGVTPDNNGFALMLQALGTRVEDGTIAVKGHDQLLQLLGIPENPPDRPIHKTGYQYWKAQQTSDKDIHDLDQGEADLGRRLWQESDEPLIAGYVKSEKPVLDDAVAASARPRWWLPMVSSDGTVLAVLLPGLAMERDVARLLAVRATGRFAAGDFDGFLADVQADEQLGRHISDSPTFIEVLVGFAIETTGNGAIAAAADSGKMTEAQCASVFRMLDGLPPRIGLGDGQSTWERWTELEIMQRVAVGTAGSLISSLGDEDSLVKGLSSMDRTRVDWDVALQQLNANYGEMTAAILSPDLAALAVNKKAVDEKVAQLKKELGAAEDLSPKENESREAYSRRVADGFSLVFTPSVDRMRILEWRTQMSEGMTRMLIAAAAVKAKTGKWPEKAEDLLAGGLKELPRDVYSAQGKGTEPLKYRVTDFGPRAYSIGENMRDDGGQRGDGGKDDIYLGGEGPPAPAPAPTAPAQAQPVPPAPNNGMP